MPDGTIAYYISQINRKLVLIRPKLNKKDRELLDEIVDTDLVELAAVVKAIKAKSAKQ